ncbi:MAG TPA: L-idonate 5-dehydrogenase [Geminicoccaceae bacterium]
MRACVLHRARDLRLEERAAAPLGPDQVRVRVGAGGICGSDLHYYFEGRVGDFAVREPLILGHEVAGDVVEIGRAVARVRIGDRVAVNPSRPCWRCRACQEGRTNLCARMSFYGSAAVFPHVQGAFQEQLVCDESQCHVVPPSTPYAVAAMAEPLAVCLHAVRRAGPLLGRRVLITGCGPIGALTCLAARAAGAAHVTVTDVVDPPLRVAEDIGADETINAAGAPERIAAYQADKGWFDVALEASGSPQALITCLACTRPGGRIVQLGMLPSGDIALPLTSITPKEIELIGTFRFHEEFGLAVAALASGRFDVSPVLSGTFPAEERDAAFAAAADRRHHMKVQLVFDA